MPERKSHSGIGDAAGKRVSTGRASGRGSSSPARRISLARPGVRTTRASGSSESESPSPSGSASSCAVGRTLKSERVLARSPAARRSGSPTCLCRCRLLPRLPRECEGAGASRRRADSSGDRLGSRLLRGVATGRAGNGRRHRATPIIDMAERARYGRRNSSRRASRTRAHASGPLPWRTREHRRTATRRIAREECPRAAPRRRARRSCAGQAAGRRASASRRAARRAGTSPGASRTIHWSTPWPSARRNRSLTSSSLIPRTSAVLPLARRTACSTASRRYTWKRRVGAGRSVNHVAGRKIRVPSVAAGTSSVASAARPASRASQLTGAAGSAAATAIESPRRGR